MSKKMIVVFIAVCFVLVGITVYSAQPTTDPKTGKIQGDIGKPKPANWSFIQSVTSAKVKPDGIVKIGTLRTTKGSLDLVLRLKDGVPVSKKILKPISGMVFQPVPGAMPVTIEVEGSAATPMMRNCRDIGCAVSQKYDCAVCKMSCDDGSIVFDCLGADCGPVYGITCI